MERTISISNAIELTNLICVSDVYIYGAGYISELFFEALERRALLENIKGILVSDGREGGVFHGFTVRSIKQYEAKEGDLICIAVHESIFGSIQNTLNNYEIKNSVWVEPYISEMRLEASCISQEILPIKLLKKNITNSFNVAIRWSVIEQYYNLNDFGYELYKKSMGNICTSETASIRLHWFLSLIESFDQKGYYGAPISVDKNLMIIDGEHRFTLAIYHEIKEIECRVFDYDNYHKCDTAPSEDRLIEIGLKSKEIDYLKCIRCEISGHFA